MFDMLKNLGGAGGLLSGLGDFEVIGKGIVDFQKTLDSRTTAIIRNQHAIMEKLGIVDLYDDGATFEGDENAG